MAGKLRICHVLVAELMPSLRPGLGPKDGENITNGVDKWGGKGVNLVRKSASIVARPVVLNEFSP